MASTFSLLRSKLLPSAVARATTHMAPRTTTLLWRLQTVRRFDVATTTAPISSIGSRYMSSQALSDILARELAEEVDDGRTEKPEELVELQSTIEKDWTLVDDGAMTRLIRSVGSSKVIVSFHCQDTVEEEGVDYEEEEEEMAVPFRYEILVSKAGKTLVLNCISNGGQTTVDGASMTTDDIETVQNNGIVRTQYQGPEFPELAGDLQDAFHEYVETELGITEDVSVFIAMYADYKEQQEYVQFLKDVPKVL